MRQNIPRSILITVIAVVEFTAQFFLPPPPPCVCPMPRCGSNCFQVSTLANPCSTTSYGGSYGQQNQPSSAAGYISGSSYGRNYNPTVGYESNNINLEQQQQQYEHQQQKRQYQYNYQPTQYVPETTSYPSSNDIEQLGFHLLPPKPPPPPPPVLPQDESNHVMDSLNDIANRSTSIYLSPASATEEILEITKQTSLSPFFEANNGDFYDEIFITATTLEPPTVSRIVYPGNKIQRASFDVMKRKNAFLRKNTHSRSHAVKTVPFSPATCNSHRLGKVILKAITDDVAESKRSVTEAAEHAYHGVKFDVICAQGDFSYTVHSRRYCEASKNDITCFAFR